MIKAKRKDKEFIIEMLTHAFEQNPGISYMVKDDARKLIRISHLMEYAYQICALFGKILISDDGKACALVLYPGKKRFSLRCCLLDLNLLFGKLGLKSALEVLNSRDVINRYHPKNSYHVWFIGVDPKYSNMGIGTDLMEEIIADADRRRKPIYLETYLSRNLQWFQKFGFEVFREINLGAHVYFLRRQVFHYFLK